MIKQIVALVLVMLAALVQADEGSKPEAPWTLLDQFDQAYTLNDQLQIILVARNMDGAELVNQALEGKPEGYLQARNAVFVADVSRMPQVISALFAVPAMREYNYRVLLDRQPRVAPRYPGAVDKVLWVEMDSGRVKAQREFSDPLELEQALEQAAK